VSHPRWRLPRTSRPAARPPRAASWNHDQLVSHLRRALDNGLSKDELVHAFTHLAFYAGWPNAMSAMGQLKQVTEG
jgi:4-carboxymuconolactone decarboxylase